MVILDLDSHCTCNNIKNQVDNDKDDQSPNGTNSEKTKCHMPHAMVWKCCWSPPSLKYLQDLQVEA